MIPRYQRIAFWSLVGGCLLMAIFLIRGCQRTDDRITAGRDQSPIPAPSGVPVETVQVAVANDADATLTLDGLTLPLPPEPAARARLILDRMFADSARPNAPHPLPPGPAIADVFFVPLPINNTGTFGSQTPTPQQAYPDSSPYGLAHLTGSVLAVINLNSKFADAHPSGILPEDLTLRSVIATLHANFPEVEQVRFLVDGKSRDTLAGHADLTRPYRVADPLKLIHPLGADGNIQ